jgi:hypothetical protein
MTDNKGNDAGAGAGDDDKDDDKHEPVLADDLDSLNDKIQSDEQYNRSTEDSDDDAGSDDDKKDGEKDDDDSDAKGDDDKSDDDAAGAGSGDVSDDDSDDEDKGTGAPADEEEGDAAAADDDKKDDDAVAPTPPEIDDDITQPGKYKVEFVDEDGNKFYVTSVRQLPDDFEPQSQKAYGAAIEDLSEKRSEYKSDVAKYEDDKAKFDTAGRVKSLRESWNSDIERLSKDGIKIGDSVIKLPEDATDREKAIKGTYALMSAELKNNQRTLPFASAFELYQAREARAAAAAQNDDEAEKKKEEDAEKKKKGGRVMGSGSGGAPKQPAGSGGVRKAPPVGTTLDQIHQGKLGTL